MKACLVGAGSIGLLHLDALTQKLDKNSISVVEVDLEKINQIGAKTNKIYKNLQDTLESNYDFYDICLPTFLHFETLDFLLKNTNSFILCEKPLVLNLDELNTLLNEYPDFGSRVKCAFVERFNDAFIEARQWAKKCPGPYSLEFSREAFSPNNPWLKDPKKGGDVLLDLGVHDLDATFWISGSSFKNLIRSNKTDSKSSVEISLSNGSKAIINSSWDLNPNHPYGIRNSIKITSSDGQVFIHDSDTESISINGNTHSCRPRFPESYYLELSTFLDPKNVLNERFPKKNELENLYLALKKINEGKYYES